MVYNEVRIMLGCKEYQVYRIRVRASYINTITRWERIGSDNKTWVVSLWVIFVCDIWLTLLPDILLDHILNLTNRTYTRIMYCNRLCCPSEVLVHLGTNSDYLTDLRVAKTSHTLSVTSPLNYDKKWGSLGPFKTR